MNSAKYNYIIIKISSGNTETPGKQGNKRLVLTCAFEFVDALIARRVCHYVTPFYTNKNSSLQHVRGSPVIEMDPLGKMPWVYIPV